MMRYLLLLIVFVSFDILAEDSSDNQRHRDHGGPRFTDEQETCLKGILGERGKGERPSKEKMEAAFAKCGIEKPQGGPPADKNNQDNNQGN